MSAPGAAAAHRDAGRRGGGRAGGGDVSFGAEAEDLLQRRGSRAVGGRVDGHRDHRVRDFDDRVMLLRDSYLLFK